MSTYRLLEQGGARNRARGVFFVTPYPLSRITGIGRFVQELQKALRSEGICSRVAYPRGDSISEAASDMGIPLRWRTFRNLELALKTAVRVIRYRSTFQVLHAQQAHLQTFFAILIASVLGKPSVLTVHVWPPVASGWLQKSAHEAIARLSVRFASRTVTVSPFVDTSPGLDRFGIIENGVDTDFFQHSPEGRAALRADLGLGDGIVFVFAGRWTTSKGLDVLLKAAGSKELGQRRFKLMLLGEPTPDEPGLLERSMHQFSEPSRVVRVGAVFDDLADYLSAGDVLVAPSRYEGMPLSVLEAMAVGLPVLASDIPVHRMLVERSGVGWIFPCGDSEGLAITMAQIIDRGIPRQWAAQARAAIVRYNNLRTVVSRYAAAYNEILGVAQPDARNGGSPA